MNRKQSGPRLFRGARSAALETRPPLVTWPALDTVAAVPEDVLIDADTIRSPELRHEIPASVLDPFLYGERDGAAFAAVSPLDAATIAAARPDLRQLDTFEISACAT